MKTANSTILLFFFNSKMLIIKRGQKVNVCKVSYKKYPKHETFIKIRVGISTNTHALRSSTRVVWPNGRKSEWIKMEGNETQKFNFTPIDRSARICSKSSPSQPRPCAKRGAATPAPAHAPHGRARRGSKPAPRPPAAAAQKWRWAATRPAPPAQAPPAQAGPRWTAQTQTPCSRSTLSGAAPTRSPARRKRRVRLGAFTY